LPATGPFDALLRVPRQRQRGSGRSQIAPQIAFSPSVRVKTDDVKKEWTGLPVASLPKVLADYVTEGAEANYVDPAMIAAPMLAVLSGCIGNTAEACLPMDTASQRIYGWWLSRSRQPGRRPRWISFVSH